MPANCSTRTICHPRVDWPNSRVFTSIFLQFDIWKQCLSSKSSVTSCRFQKKSVRLRNWKRGKNRNKTTLELFSARNSSATSAECYKYAYDWWWNIYACARGCYIFCFRWDKTCSTEFIEDSPTLSCCVPHSTRVRLSNINWTFSLNCSMWWLMLLLILFVTIFFDDWHHCDRFYNIFCQTLPTRHVTRATVSCHTLVHIFWEPPILKTCS